MIERELLLLPLEEAKRRLLQAGFLDIRCVQTGVEQHTERSSARVVRMRELPDCAAELLYTHLIDIPEDKTQT